MKASELITQLQKCIAEVGDLPTMLIDGDFASSKVHAVVIEHDQAGKPCEFTIAEETYVDMAISNGDYED